MRCRRVVCFLRAIGLLHMITRAGLATGEPGIHALRNSRSSGRMLGVVTDSRERPVPEAPGVTSLRSK